MKIYLFDEDTKEYQGEENAYIDPRESQKQGTEVYLLPPNAVFSAPPAEQNGYARIYDGGWQYVVDNRGKTAVNAERGLFEVDYIGEKEGDTIVTDEMQAELDNGTLVIDGGAVVAKPAEMKAAEKRTERDGLLSLTDKYMLADFPVSEDEREEYCSYRQYLRDIPETEGFPDIAIKSFDEWKGA